MLRTCAPYPERRGCFCGRPWPSWLLFCHSISLATASGTRQILMTTDSDAVMRVRDLSVEFVLRHGIFHAVDHVSFDLKPGRTLGLVGESGSGKSVTARALMQLVDPPGYIASGAMMLGDTDIA